MNCGVSYFLTAMLHYQVVLIQFIIILILFFVFIDYGSAVSLLIVSDVVRKYLEILKAEGVCLEFFPIGLLWEKIKNQAGIFAPSFLGIDICFLREVGLIKIKRTLSKL